MLTRSSANIKIILGLELDESTGKTINKRPDSVRASKSRSIVWKAAIASDCCYEKIESKLTSKLSTYLSSGTFRPVCLKMETSPATN